VTQINEWETAVLYKDIFVERCYLRHGIVTPSSGAVVDCGANIGMVTLFLHHERPGLPIVAVEPAPVPFIALRANVRRYEINAQLIQASLGAERGVAPFSYYPGNTMTSGAHADPVRDAELTQACLRNEGFAQVGDPAFVRGLFDRQEYPCQVRSISEILDELQVDHVGLLKIDVEHAEMDVLAGMRHDHWAGTDQVVVEVHGGRDALHRVRALLEGSGLRVSVEQEQHAHGTSLHMVYATRRS